MTHNPSPTNAAYAQSRMFDSLIEELETLLCEEPQWHHPGTESEAGEIHRTAQDLGIDHERIRSAVASGKVGPLHPDHWAKLQNTNSNEVRGKNHAKAMAKQNGSNIHKIAKGFRKDSSMPAPIVLHRQGHDPYLIGGNTRLMAAKVHGVQPHVVHAHLDDKRDDGP